MPCRSSSMSKDIEMCHMFYFIVLNYGLQLQNCSRIGCICLHFLPISKFAKLKPWPHRFGTMIHFTTQGEHLIWWTSFMCNMNDLLTNVFAEEKSNKSSWSTFQAFIHVFKIHNLSLFVETWNLFQEFWVQVQVIALQKTLHSYALINERG